MKFSNLKQAFDLDVYKWLEEELQLTPYQKERLRNEELIRFSPYFFYEKEDKKRISFLWRITIVFYFPYFILLCIFAPLKWVCTGNRYYGRKFMDTFHNKWVRKIGL